DRGCAWRREIDARRRPGLWSCFHSCLHFPADMAGVFFSALGLLAPGGAIALPAIIPRPRWLCGPGMRGGGGVLGYKAVDFVLGHTFHAPVANPSRPAGVDVPFLEFGLAHRHAVEHAIGPEFAQHLHWSFRRA